MSLQTTSSQTIGPYLHIGLTWLVNDNLAVPGVAYVISNGGALFSLGLLP